MSKHSIAVEVSLFATPRNELSGKSFARPTLRARLECHAVLVRPPRHTHRRQRPTPGDPQLLADDGADAGRTLAHPGHADMLLSAHLLAVRPNDSHRNRPHGRGGFVVARRSTKMKEPLMIRSTHVLLVDRALSGCSPPQVFLSDLKATDEQSGRISSFP